MVPVKRDTIFYFVIYCCLVSWSAAAKIPDNACDVHFQPGSIMLGGIFNTYTTDKTPCDGSYFVPVISMVESMTYAVRVINQRDDILPNVTLGYKIRNNCGDEDITVWTMLTMTSPAADIDYKKACPNHERLNSEKVIGIVGTGKSSTSFLAAKVAAVYDIPIVSYFATSDELSNVKRFPYFLRTVPPDKFQVGAIMDLLLHYNWKYIALFYSIDTYGVHGARQIQTLAEDLGVCIAVNLPVSNVPSNSELRELANKLVENDKISVIVIFSVMGAARGVIRAVREFDISRRLTFIGSDGWGDGFVDNEATAKLLRGSIFVRQLGQPIKDFRDYYKLLPENQHLASQWYRGMLQDIKKSSNCTEWESCLIQNPRMEMQMINSVFAFAFAVENNIKSKCHSNTLCDEALDGTSLLQQIYGVSFEGPDGTRFEFDKNGDTSGKYLIKNGQLINGVYEMIDIGIWDPNNSTSRLALNEDMIQWNSLTETSPTSLCVNECGPGAIAVPLKKKCCWGCQQCPAHAIVINNSQCQECSVLEWPDENFIQCVSIHPDYIDIYNPVILVILSMSLIGIFLCGLTLVGLCVYQRHPLIKASSRELSCVNLIGLSMACAASLVTVVTPSAVSCILSDICMSLCFSFIFAPILFKVNRIWRIFQAGKKSVQRPRFVNSKQQLILVSATIFIQVLITGSSSLFASSSPALLIPSPRKPSLTIYCKLGYGFAVSCIYNLLLICVCCYFALRARKLPSNYNESKFIAISVYSTLVVCVAAVPVYSTALDVTQMVATLCVTLLLNSYLTLICIYLPKLYAIQFAGDDLAIETWRCGDAGNSVNVTQVHPVTN